jgi:aryl-alcohol dehydrogenase-like predicted oxidoreductase
MLSRPFGKTGVQVPEIGFGAWAIGGDGPGVVGYGPTDDGESIAALRRAVDLGMTFVDTASVYGQGRSEELIARAGVRERVFLATKCGFDWSSGRNRSNWSPGFLQKSIEESLRRLRTDRVDLLQLHNPGAGDLDALAVLEEARRAGKTRLVGVSILTVEAALAAAERGVDAVQLVYNYLDGGHRARTFPALAARGTAVIAREPLARGLLTGKFARDAKFSPEDVRSNWKPEDFAAKMEGVEEFLSLVKPGLSPARAALKYVLSCPEVAVAIPGAKTARQVEENAGASDGRYRLVGDVFESEDIDRGFGGDA